MVEISSIEWSPKAKENLKQIIDYISRDSIQNANSFKKEIFQYTENLKNFPRMGKKVIDLRDPDIRQLIFKNTYRIIYRVFKDKIKIVTLKG